MMKKSIFIGLACLFLMWACKNREEKPQEQTPAEKVEVEQDNAAAWKKDISLDKGRLWKANEETTEGIVAMSALIKTASPANPEDYRQLGEALNEEKNRIIEKCTMKGASHDNLHIFLQPLIEKVAALQEVSSVEEGQKITEEIEKHLQDYHSYFV